MELDDDDPLERAWERMQDGRDRARKERIRALVIGLLVPMGGLFVLFLLAASSR